MLLNFLYFHPVFFFLLLLSSVVLCFCCCCCCYCYCCWSIFYAHTYTSFIQRRYFSVLFGSDFLCFHRFWRSTHSHSPFHTIRITHLNLDSNAKRLSSFFPFFFCFVPFWIYRYCLFFFLMLCFSFLNTFTSFFCYLLYICYYC